MARARLLGIGCWHMGHTWLISSHWTVQSPWKWCKQGKRIRVIMSHFFFFLPPPPPRLRLGLGSWPSIQITHDDFYLVIASNSEPSSIKSHFSQTLDWWFSCRNKIGHVYYFHRLSRNPIMNIVDSTSTQQGALNHFPCDHTNKQLRVV